MMALNNITRNVNKICIPHDNGLGMRQGYICNKDSRKLKELKKKSYTFFRENDIIIAKITPCMENGKCAIATNLENGIGMGSSEFHVIRVDETRARTKYFQY